MTRNEADEKMKDSSNRELWIMEAKGLLKNLKAQNTVEWIEVS